MSDVTIELREDELHIQEVGVAFDAHMHIQSSHTSPLPLLWHVIKPSTPLPILNRFLVDKLASPFIVGSQAGGNVFGGPGYLTFTEDVIGRIVAGKNEITFSEMTSSEKWKEHENIFYKSIFCPMIVMPMDMEYAHISGFDDFGAHTIYHENEKSRWYYRHRVSIYKWSDTGREVPVVEDEGKKIKLGGLFFRESEKKKKDYKIGKGTFKRKYIEQLEYSKLYETYCNYPEMYYSLDKEQIDYLEKMKDEERRLNSGKNEDSIERSEMFVKWNNQTDRTMKAAFENPLHLIPMYHYDPRRWNDGEYDKKSLSHGPFDYPFQKKYIATNNIAEAESGSTIFAGIKMYPPLGYKPFDDRFGIKDSEGKYTGNRIEKFYELCNEKKVPVLAHCSPGGIVTHDSRKYMEFDKKENELIKFDHAGEKTKNEYNKLKEERERLQKYIDSNWDDASDSMSFRLSSIKRIMAEMRNRERDCYFANEYVHPKNWEPVIKEYENINVCMAHFGGAEWIKSFFGNPGEIGVKSPWIKKTIELLKTYKNAYTDISCFTLKLNEKGKIVNDNDSEKNSFKKEFTVFLKNALAGEYDNGNCKILDKILFGTDWYLTLNTYKHKDYQPYSEEYKTFLDSIDKGLWIKFSMINPYYYYGFDQPEKIESLFVGLKKKAEGGNEFRLEERKVYLLGLTEGGDFGKNKMKNLEETVKNKYGIKTGRQY